jgi:hypothetical protein
MDNRGHIITVTVEISSKYPPIDGVWHIKWEPNLVKAIHCKTIQFSCFDMETTIKKITYLVAMHPEEYFSEIKIKR